MTPFYIFSPQGDSVTLIIDGIPSVIPKSDPRWSKVLTAIKDQDWDAVRANSVAEAPKALAQFGAVTVYGGHVVANGEELHSFLVDMILKAAADGLPLEPLGLFQANVLENPDPRARADLYTFCAKSGLPITDDGCIIAYKIIGKDYYDIYSHSVFHGVGQTVSMPRGACDPDPDKVCSTGLHFCSADYLPHYGTNKGSRIVLVKVNPRDVTAFPTDYNNAKARCCRYEVIQEIDRETAPDFFKGVIFFNTLKKDEYILFTPNVGFWLSRYAGYTQSVLDAHVYSADDVIMALVNGDDIKAIHIYMDDCFAAQHDGPLMTWAEIRDQGCDNAILIPDLCS